MNLTDAARMLLTESAAHPELLRDARLAYDEFAGGRQVPHTLLSRMLGEAGRKGVFPALRERHGERAVNDMITVLAREIDRQAPVAPRAR
ncbi:hypothetical protein DPM19_20170 [Actinomadura craniellae]|uniref:Uncharacterized protein n=1 Tax=Actinomadura craniellae TaxID=2231787 RepID=A0A365H2R8_9ACTN|nr:hypothetical protein [Actinomadura craniellae]RAY13391.1 hypothetical protein DPM19_20170 [Actinomadura craniellae]